jgi:MSHA biogenesis protein MshG
MQIFRYKGRKHGQVVSGQLEGTSSEAAAIHLLGLGITPIEIAEVRQSDDALAWLRTRLQWSKVDLADLIIFLRQMYTMARAGVPIVRAIRAITEATHNPLLVEALQDVADSIEAGKALASSFQRHPKIFSNLFVSTIRVGEDTGHLEEAFAQLATYLDLERSTRKRLKSASRYPLLVVSSIAVALVILNLFALPIFAEAFAELGAQLPWPTRFLIRSSELSVQYWLHTLLTAVAVGVGLRTYLNTKRGRFRWHRYKLGLPIVGPIIEKATLARFARTFALALRSGVPLIRALNLAAAVLDNDYMADAILLLRSNVERGETLLRAATASGLFTPLVLQMMGIGEETGALDNLLEEVAEFYDRDVDYELKQIGDAIEPILIVGVGILVLVMALGVYLPMWDLSRAAHGG